MHIPLTPPRWLHWRRYSIALLALAALAGCSTQGDFGEVHSSLVSDEIHNWVGKRPADRPFSFFFEQYLTDDEHQLRDLAYPYMEAPYERKKWYSVAGEYWIVDSPERFNRFAYANNLMSEHFRSASARYAQLIEDIRNDTTRLPQFFETASRVTDIDDKRRKSMSYVHDMSEAERKAALARMAENASIIALVRKNLVRRIGSYRVALERLVIMTPMTQAVEAERLLNQFQVQVAHYQSNGAPTWANEQSLSHQD